MDDSEAKRHDELEGLEQQMHDLDLTKAYMAATVREVMVANPSGLRALDLDVDATVDQKAAAARRVLASHAGGTEVEP